jgi:hypothetical protein
VWEVAFSCPLCSRMFLDHRPPEAPLPPHLDALLGTPCAGSGRAVEAWLAIPDPGQEWPHWRGHGV